MLVLENGLRGRAMGKFARFPGYKRGTEEITEKPGWRRKGKDLSLIHI